MTTEGKARYSLANHLRAASGADLELRVLRTREELARARGDAADRLAWERLNCDMLAGEATWSLPGVCQACGIATQLQGNWQFSDGRTANFREHLVCPTCLLNNRQRFMAHLVQTVASLGPARADVYLYEQVTPFFAWAKRALAGNVVGSEYLGHDLPSGRIIDGVRHEDAQALGFDTSSFDVIVSCDVFEHVPDVDGALSESARVLRPGGVMFFSIPFYEGQHDSVRRSDLVEGAVVELLPAQYHGNPLSEGGSLVFHDFGWDVLDRARRAGFHDAYLLGYYSWLYGYLGGGLQIVFIAER